MGNNDSSVETFLQWIKASDNIVFFGGAGVSTESGIPDFRSVDGLYNQKYDYPPETILSHTFYRKHPQEFYRFYRDKMLCLDAEPNITHYKLAELEKAGKQEMLEMVKEISDMVNVHFIRQKEPRGLGHAILCAKTFVGNEPFAVLLGDDVVYNDRKPCLKQLIDCYGEYRTSVLGVQTVAEQDVNKYGIVGGIHIEDRVYKVKRLVEKPAIEESPSNLSLIHI